MRHNSGNCLVLILAILLLVWLTCWGGCSLIKKKTAEGLEDKPVPAAPEAPKK
jgi:hypothetical protein